MTFVLNNKIVCVEKWSIEKQNTRINRRLHCDRDECILYMILPNGDYKKLATLRIEAFDQTYSAINNHCLYVDLRQYELDYD